MLKTASKKPAGPQRCEPSFAQVIPGCAAEVISGDVFLSASGNRKTFVNLRVYRTSLCHFAAVFPAKQFCNPVACINLRNYEPQLLSEQKIFLMPKSCDGLSVFLDLPHEGVSLWMNALKNCSGRANSRHRQSENRAFALPSVVEADEEGMYLWLYEFQLTCSWWSLCYASHQFHKHMSRLLKDKRWASILDEIRYGHLLKQRQLLMWSILHSSFVIVQVYFWLCH